MVLKIGLEHLVQPRTRPYFSLVKIRKPVDQLVKLGIIPFFFWFFDHLGF